MKKKKNKSSKKIGHGEKKARTYNGLTPSGMVSAFALSSCPSGWTSYANEAPSYNTLLLLHGDGTNGSATFSDSSPNARVISTSGTVTNSSSQGKFGASSISFGGGYLINSDSSLNFNTTDFTVDGWFNTNNAAQTCQGIFGNAVDFYGVNLELNETGSKVLTLFVGSGSWACSGYGCAGSTAIQSNTWYHFATVKRGNNYYVYLNGNLEISLTGGSMTWSGSNFYIGLPQLTTRPFNGYIDEFRVSNVARWTSNFSPPALAYSVPIYCQKN